MKIKISAAGIALNNGKITQKAGCVACLEIEDDLSRKAIRYISYPIGNATTPCAEINAARIGLASVLRKYRKTALVSLYTTQYVVNLLERNDDKSYVMEPKKNEKEVADLRRWASYYTSLSTHVYDKESISDIYELAKECANSQRPKDSGTNLI